MIVAIVTLLSILYIITILLFLIGLLTKKSGSNTTQYNVTVVIAARNEEDNIGNILEDLAQQTYPADKYNVIVVNDGSTDNTQVVIDTFTNRFSNFSSLAVQAVPNGFSPKKFALQQAIEQSKSELILSTDADCRVQASWIESMVSYFTPEIGFVIGFSQYGTPHDIQNTIENLQAFDFMQMMGVAAGTSNMGLPMAASGQNLAYRRDAFLEVGGFNKIAHRISGDDVLLLQLINRYTQYKSVFAADPKTFAVSKAQPTWSDFINQRIRWASNGSYQLYLNIPFFLYLLLVYLYSFSIALAFFGAVFLSIPMSFFIGALFIKILADGAITLKSASYYNRRDLLKWYPLWFVLQVPYIVYVGFQGTFGNFKWKGRKHSTDFNKTPRHLSFSDQSEAKE